MMALILRWLKFDRVMVFCWTRRDSTNGFLYLLPVVFMFAVMSPIHSQLI